MADDPQDQSMPKPNPALGRLNCLIGTWRLEGHTIGSPQQAVVGTATFQWLHGSVGDSFFLQQDMDLNYAGTPIKSHELIGYNPKTQAFSSLVFSNMAADPWPYEWDIQGDTWTISIKHGAMDARFTARFAPDRNSFKGHWRPNAGADAQINSPYDISGSRIS